MPAAISLQSSVGRYLMNYLLSEVMFTSLYIYWDSPLLVLLEKSKFWQRVAACCCCCSGFEKEENDSEKQRKSFGVMTWLPVSNIRDGTIDIYMRIFSF